MKAAKTMLGPGLPARLEQDGGLTIGPVDNPIFVLDCKATQKLTHFLRSQRADRPRDMSKACKCPGYGEMATDCPFHFPDSRSIRL